MVQGLPMLVLEDFGAESLARLHRKQRFSLPQILSLAVRIADTLADLHDRGIVHGDINPANILLDPVSDVVKSADFGSSQTMAGEHLAAESLQRLEGTLAYMSPEQTGRMNRPVDHRTDFYSLGVSLYELCTGRLPFATDDPLQLVHSHLARQPLPVHQIEPAIPEAVSDIVRKLMAKMPEDRYQNGRGCAHDFRECRRQLEDHGRIQGFALGQGDHIEQFRICHVTDPDGNAEYGGARPGFFGTNGLGVVEGDDFLDLANGNDLQHVKVPHLRNMYTARLRLRGAARLRRSRRRRATTWGRSVLRTGEA